RYADGIELMFLLYAFFPQVAEVCLERLHRVKLLLVQKIIAKLDCCLRHEASTRVYSIEWNHESWDRKIPFNSSTIGVESTHLSAVLHFKSSRSLDGEDFSSSERVPVPPTHRDR